MSKALHLSALALLLVMLAAPAHSAQTYATWGDIVDDMNRILDKSYTIYLSGDIEQSKELVNTAYFGFYEKLGVERAVLTYISGKRASLVEYQFAAVKRLMTEQADNHEVRASLNELMKLLSEDARQLDGSEETGLGVFIASFLILLREGFEAILVVAAIAAYLARSGNGRLTPVVYKSAAAAIAASVLLAIALQKVFSISGASQEMLEGFTMLLAVAVLFLVSNWMVSKAESEAWKNYIRDKVASAVTTGSVLALAAASFLAVFREGAETILFYQALLANTQEYPAMLWAGILAASLCLIVIFVVVRFGAMRLPLRPFFIGTSILMYLMAIIFAGGGVKELQEADLISVTPVSFLTDSIDLLGIHPTVETLVPQGIMLVLAAASFIYYRHTAAARKAAV